MSSIAQLFESGEQSRQKGHFRNLVMLSKVDGVISSKEFDLLKRIAMKLSLTEEQIAEIIANPNDYPEIPPVSREERYERFIQLIQLLIVDGHVELKELALVKRFGVHLGFDPQRVEEKFPLIVEHLRNGMTREEVLKSIL